MIDERIAELQQARSLLVEFLAVKQLENERALEAFSPGKLNVQSESHSEPASQVPEQQGSDADHALTAGNPSRPDDVRTDRRRELTYELFKEEATGNITAMARQESIRKPQAVPRKAVVQSVAGGALGGVIPLGPVVVSPKEQQTDPVVASSVVERQTLFGRSESSLESLAREVAVRMGISPTGSSSARLS